MKYGFTVPSRGPLATPESIVTIAKKGESLGFDSISLGDHILVPRTIESSYPYTDSGEYPGSANGSSLEQLSVLSFLAGQTSNIRLSTSVMVVPHRNPLVAAKSLATIDVLSRGRLVVGVGTGWMREEFEALGVQPFDERGAVTDDYIQAMKELWTSSSPSYNGRYCSFKDISFLPKPLQKPHPPLWVGGESKRAIRRAARFCDGWCPIDVNPQFPLNSPERLSIAMEELRLYADEAERSADDIEVIYRTHRLELSATTTNSSNRQQFSGDSNQIAGDISRYRDIGVNNLMVDLARVATDLEDMLCKMEDFAEKVWPKV
ncbi:MAG: hypothetical protein CL886_06700 [Dehalococcoidia bacterium]|nr:hypothetical protein [Dehalococcoidia bacterium]